MARIIATTQETIAIHEALKGHLSPTGDGAFFYAGGLTDEDIARKAAPRLSAAHVARIRTEMFGKLGKPPEAEPADFAAIAANMTTDLAQIKSAMTRLGAIDTTLNSVEAAVARIEQRVASIDSAARQQF
ncbi:hypothetical protein BJ122_102213 [Rhodopseudomonas faecalis]|uniref:Uncharacterized protein n=1 Tax=Rhodopseudomonas faecalis TaxID=99655 RepID=A0A318TM96_9BRAD|nr:hypothetical protein [Rhodopseudomonas faecalis]PYF04987.1 hypothetical protein BJ122_102213 [Rhodopseudomonas faecalis]